MPCKRDFTPYYLLAAAVIGDAADDYIEGLKTKNEYLINMNERFFRSDLFEIYSDGVDGERWIELCKEKAKKGKTHGKTMDSRSRRNKVGLQTR